MVTRSRKNTPSPQQHHGTPPKRGNGSKILIKKGAQVAKIQIQEQGNAPQRVFTLLGEHYLVGRGSRCDIQVSNPLTSQVHCLLYRDPDNPHHFCIQDQGSSNGTYVGRHRLKHHRLHHGDVITLGPPELVNVPRIVYLNPPSLRLKGVRLLLGIGLALLLTTAAAIAWQWQHISVRPLPTHANGPVKVFADDGRTVINPVQQEIHREFERLSDFSPYLPQAVIASEDSRFYWHFGVDPYGIARAIYITVFQQGPPQGASTLTQQLARSLFTDVGRERTAGRKLREIMVALKLEAVYSKDEILKTYLNRVYLGGGNFGFEDAAQFYFAKSAQDLDIAEAATLVAMLPAPNLYNPVQDYATSVQLRNRVIERMAMLGMIEEQEANRARRSRIQISPRATQSLSSRQAPYFYHYVFGELNRLLGEEVASEGNFLVQTSLNLPMQTLAETSLNTFLRQRGQTNNISQGAVVTLDSRTGNILAMVGGRDFQQSQFNRASQAQRQPGSTFKLFTYTAAIAKGISPSRTYSCAPLSWGGQRYKACERSGDAPAISLARGLIQSENTVALRIAQEIGLDQVIAVAREFGITTPLRKTPGLVLGDSETRVLEMTSAYGAIANQGQWIQPHGVLQIGDGGDCANPDQRSTCREVYQADPNTIRQKQVVSAATAATLTRLLQGVVDSGTGAAAQIGYGAAGKTGTTDQAVDLWFIGFLPQKHLVTGVWLGNDDSQPTHGSSALAAAVWGQYMRQAAAL